MISALGEGIEAVIGLSRLPTPHALQVDAPTAASLGPQAVSNDDPHHCLLGATPQRRSLTHRGPLRTAYNASLVLAGLRLDQCQRLIARAGEDFADRCSKIVHGLSSYRSAIGLGEVAEGGGLSPPKRGLPDRAGVEIFMGEK